MPKIANIKRNKPSKRPIINEKRSSNSDFSGLTLEQAKELANLLETKNHRISIQKKKSSIVNNQAQKKLISSGR